MLTAARRLYRWLDARLGVFLPENVRHAAKGMALDLARALMPVSLGASRPMASSRVILPSWLVAQMHALSDIEPKLRPRDYAPALRRIRPDYADPRVGDAYFRLLAQVPGPVREVWIMGVDGGAVPADLLASRLGRPDLMIAEDRAGAGAGSPSILLDAPGLSPEQLRQVLGRLCLQLAPERIVVNGVGLGLDLLAGHWLALSQESSLQVVLPDPGADGLARVLGLVDQGAAAVAYIASTADAKDAWCQRLGIDPGAIAVLPPSSPQRNASPT